MKTKNMKLSLNQIRPITIILAGLFVSLGMAQTPADPGALSKEVADGIKGQFAGKLGTVEKSYENISASDAASKVDPKCLAIPANIREMAYRDAKAIKPVEKKRAHAVAYSQVLSLASDRLSIQNKASASKVKCSCGTDAFGGDKTAHGVRGKSTCSSTCLELEEVIPMSNAGAKGKGFKERHTVSLVALSDNDKPVSRAVLDLKIVQDQLKDPNLKKEQKEKLFARLNGFVGGAVAMGANRENLARYCGYDMLYANFGSPNSKELALNDMVAWLNSKKDQLPLTSVNAFFNDGSSSYKDNVVVQANVDEFFALCPGALVNYVARGVEDGSISLPGPPAADCAREIEEIL